MGEEEQPKRQQIDLGMVLGNQAWGVERQIGWERVEVWRQRVEHCFSVLGQQVTVLRVFRVVHPFRLS